MKLLRRQRGITLLELILVVGALSVVAVAGMKKYQVQAENMVARGVVEDVNHIQRAAMRYRRAEGSWPANVNTLVSGNYLSATDIASPFGGNYIVAPAGNDLRVSINAQEPRYANRIVGHLPRSSLAGNTVITLIDPPGDEASHDALYARDGSRNLTGHMDANNRNINNANQVNAQSVRASTDLRVNNSIIRANGSNTQIRQSGTLLVQNASGGAGSLQTGTLRTTGTARIDGVLTAQSNINAQSNVNVTGQVSASRLTLNGQPTVAGRVRANDMVLDRVVAEGGTCSPNGTIARNSTGLILSCQSGFWLQQADPAKKIQAGESLPSVCSGVMTGGLCTGLFYIDVVFETAFDNPPNVVSAYSRLYEPSGCLYGATDAERFYATNITTSGFRLWGGGSPVGTGPCGVAFDSYWHPAYGMWIAMDY